MTLVGPQVGSSGVVLTSAQFFFKKKRIYIEPCNSNKTSDGLDIDKVMF